MGREGQWKRVGEESGAFGGGWRPKLWEKKKKGFGARGGAAPLLPPSAPPAPPEPRPPPPLETKTNRVDQTRGSAAATWMTRQYPHDHVAECDAKAACLRNR